MAKAYAAVISIIIPHANSLRGLRLLLRSLEKQNCRQPFEVLVIANPATKYARTPRLKMNFPLTWGHSSMGANAARQKGIRMAQGDLLVFLDDDCRINDPLFLQKHWNHHQDPLLSGIGGPYRLAGKTTLWGRAYHHVQKSWLQSHRLPQNLHLHLLGGNSSFKKQVFENLAFDEKIIFGGTETELQIRLYRAGFRLRLCDDVVVEHDGRLSFFDFLKKSFKQGIGAAYTAQKEFLTPRFIFFRDDPKQVSCLLQWAEWLYQKSFEAGQIYFIQTQNLKVPSGVVYRSVGKRVWTQIFNRKFVLWYELRNLIFVLALGLLLKPDPEKKEASRN